MTLCIMYYVYVFYVLGFNVVVFLGMSAVLGSRLWLVFLRSASLRGVIRLI